MVLVTGATGFLGSHLMIHLLENEGNVVALYRNQRSKAKSELFFSTLKKENLFSKIRWIQGDIMDIPSLELAFEDIEYVYHCAALISFEPKKENLLRKTNIEGTANIVNFCLEKNIKKLCYVSSIAALGDLLDSKQIISEKTEWNPEINHSDYAISKYGGEMEVFRGQQEGLRVIVVNPGVIIGNTANWQEGSGKVFTTVAKKIKFYTKGSTGFVAVEDVVSILFQLMKSDIQNQKFILVSENIVYKDLLTKIANALGVQAPKWYANRALTSLISKIDWFFSTLLSKESMLSKAIERSLHSSDLYSNKKIKKALGFEFKSVSDCIEETALFYKEQKR